MKAEICQKLDNGILFHFTLKLNGTLKFHNTGSFARSMFIKEKFDTNESTLERKVFTC